MDLLGNEMAGYIKLYRSIMDHWLYLHSKPFCEVAAWIDLLMFVYRFDSKEPIQGQIQITKAGSRWTGYQELSDRWGWSKSKTRRFLKLLESDEMITLNSNTNGTLVTIVNYGDFQIERNTDEPQMNHERNTDEPRAYTEKKVNKVNKVEKVNLASGGPSESVSDEEWYKSLGVGKIYSEDEECDW